MLTGLRRRGATYGLTGDVAPSACWALDEVQCKETAIDDRDFAVGRHLENPGTLAVTVKRRGEPAELAFTLLEAPVATTRVADLIAEIAPGAVERFPVEVGGHAGKYEILNVVQVVDAIDQPIAPIGGLHESVLEMDPSGQEMRAR